MIFIKIKELYFKLHGFLSSCSKVNVKPSPLGGGWGFDGVHRKERSKQICIRCCCRTFFTRTDEIKSFLKQLRASFLDTHAQLSSCLRELCKCWGTATPPRPLAAALLGRTFNLQAAAAWNPLLDWFLVYLAKTRAKGLFLGSGESDPPDQVPPCELELSQAASAPNNSYTALS